MFFQMPNVIGTQNWSSQGERSRGTRPKEDALLRFNKEVTATFASMTMAPGFEPSGVDQRALGGWVRS